MSLDAAAAETADENDNDDDLHSAADVPADAKCDPYPKPKYKDGAALFSEKYAEEFYAENKQFVGKPFGELKKTQSKHLTIQKVVTEFSEENRKYGLLVEEWRKAWPEEAARVDEVRRQNSAARRERKRRQNSQGAGRPPLMGVMSMLSGGGSTSHARLRLDPNSAGGGGSNAGALLSPEWWEAQRAFLNGYREVLEEHAELLRSANDAYFQVRDKFDVFYHFVAAMQRDREDVF